MQNTNLIVFSPFLSLFLSHLRTTYVLCISGSMESKHQQQPTAAHQTGNLLDDGHFAKS